MVFPIITENDKNLPLFVTGVGFQNPQPLIERASGFSNNQLFIVESGEGYFYSEKKSFKLKKGSVLFVPCNVYHGYFPTKDTFSMRWVSFSGNHLNDVLKHLGFTDIVCFNSSDTERFLQMHQEMLEYAESSKICNLSVLSAMFYRYIFEVRNCVLNGSFKGFDKADEIKIFLQNNYSSDISLDLLADQFKISKYALCRIFKEKYKITVFDYLLNVRIQKAKYLLTESDMKIKTISQKVGFNNESYFIKVFKKIEGITPNSFR